MNQSIKALPVFIFFALILLNSSLIDAAPAKENTFTAPSSKAPESTDKAKSDNRTYGPGPTPHIGEGPAPSVGPDKNSLECPERYHCASERSQLVCLVGAGERRCDVVFGSTGNLAVPNAPLPLPDE